MGGNVRTNLSINSVKSSANPIELLNRALLRAHRELRFRTHPHIDHRRKIIFIHVPKCAGTALAKALGFSGASHDTAAEYRDWAGPARFYGYRKVAFVRDPISRFVSLYNYARMDTSYHHDNLKPECGRHGRHLDWELVRDIDINTCVRLLIAGRLRHSRLQVQWWPQTRWLAINGQLKADFIGRVETMEQDVERLGQFLGITPAELGQVNASERTSGAEALSPASIDLLRLYYQTDYELFDYATDRLPR